jgi:hypothetical protein
VAAHPHALGQSDWRYLQLYGLESAVKRAGAHTAQGGIFATRAVIDKLGIARIYVF